MPNKIQKYTDLIHIQSRLLMDSNQTYMSMAQRQAIELIDRYAVQLANTAKQASDDVNYTQVRHQLINILTPIVGYIEMLADGWSGSLNPDQTAHIEIIHQSVNDLRDNILAYRYESDLSVSA